MENLWDVDHRHQLKGKGRVTWEGLVASVPPRMISHKSGRTQGKCLSPLTKGIVDPFLPFSPQPSAPPVPHACFNHRSTWSDILESYLHQMVQSATF